MGGALIETEERKKSGDRVYRPRHLPRQKDMAKVA
jgi:hypothetical protein